jgi:hypothetical protein
MLAQLGLRESQCDRQQREGGQQREDERWDVQSYFSLA